MWCTWCYDKKAVEENLPFNLPSDHRLNKFKYPETYNRLKEIFNQYASVDMMWYCYHTHDTQTNEALNQAIASIAPKSVCYSGSISLYSHITLAIGTHNMGYYDFFSALLKEVGVTMTPGLANFLNGKQKRKIQKRMYIRRLEVRIAWSKSQKKQLQEIYKERTNTSYGHGVALTEITNKKRKQNLEKVSATAKRCKYGSESHQRITHKDCPENPKNEQLKRDCMDTFTK
jgi:hypothetical protein